MIFSCGVPSHAFIQGCGSVRIKHDVLRKIGAVGPSKCDSRETMVLVDGVT